MSIRDYFAGISPLLRPADYQERHLDLLAQFYSTLRAAYSGTQSGNADKAQNTEVHTKIKDLFTESLEQPSWRGAYEVEQLLSYIMTVEQLNTEFPRRIEEAERHDLGYLDALKRQWEIADTENNITLKRAVLQRLLNDLQWFYSQRILGRAISRQHGVRVGMLFLSAFIAFLVVISIHFFEFGAFLRLYPGLVVGMASGFLGATFSMLLSIRKRASQGTLEEIKAASLWTTLTVRASVGLGAALILYFFFPSGLLEGVLWPNLGALGFETEGESVLPNRQWCLLFIWCFVAGFSENFVPGILAQTERRGVKESELKRIPWEQDVR